MSPTLFAALLALAPGQGVPYAPPMVLYPPPPLIGPGVEANYVVPVPGGAVPNFYPMVPAPVVIAHPDWYPSPGPAYYYGNNVTPYHSVYHGVRHVVPASPAVPPKGEPVVPKKVEDKR